MRSTTSALKMKSERHTSQQYTMCYSNFTHEYHFCSSSASAPSLSQRATNAATTTTPLSPDCFLESLVISLARKTRSHPLSSSALRSREKMMTLMTPSKRVLLSARMMKKFSSATTSSFTTSSWWKGSCFFPLTLLSLVTYLLFLAHSLTVIGVDGYKHSHRYNREWYSHQETGMLIMQPQHEQWHRHHRGMNKRFFTFSPFPRVSRIL